MSVDVLTFGCRLNAVESEVIRGIAAAATEIRDSTAPFSAVVVISASASSERDAPTGMLASILDSRAMVHAVGHAPSAPAGRDDLRALAAQSRGQFTSIFSAASFEASLDHIADQMAAEMMIDYIVPGNAPPKEDVAVGVKIPGARVVGKGVR